VPPSPCGSSAREDSPESWCGPLAAEGRWASQQGDGSLEGSDLGSESSGGWPPRPPIMKFKMRLQFSNRFKPSEGKAIFEKVNEHFSHKLVEVKREELRDLVVGWLNSVFHLAVKTEFELEVGYPIIVLTVLDTFYPKRVRWREIDWRLQYKAALLKNYSVLNAIWAEVNMEKAREFRPEHTAMRLEQLPQATPRYKVEFLKLLQRWYSMRVHHTDACDAMLRRHEYVEECKAWGHKVEFPAWVLFDREAHQAHREAARRARCCVAARPYEALPECKRLVHFLGSVEHRSM